MTAFTRTWDATYKGLPQDLDDSAEGAGHIRNIKTDVYERMIVDHSWAGDANDGKHQKVTLRAQTGDPTLDTGDVALYAKPVGSKSQLFFKDQDGNTVQLTFAGQGQFMPAGCIVAFAGAVPAGGFLLPFGQNVSRTTYSGLFQVIGTTFGAGDGSTTFTLPDLRGRVIAGLDNMGGAAAGRLTSIAGTTLGATGGEEKHVLVIAEMPVHDHNYADPGHSHVKRRPANFGAGSDNVSQGGPVEFIWRDDVSGGGAVTDSTNTATTGITFNAQGSGTAHNNLQPLIVLNYLIKT